MKLIAINTIGLTGAEILCAELARYPEIRMIPGQNFIRFKNVCYRPHDYSAMDAAEAFEMLSMHHYTRSGKCWSGLTKSMSEEGLRTYSKERHKEAFVAKAASRDFLELVHVFSETFHGTMGTAHAAAQYTGWFGNNIAANVPAYADFDRKAVVIDFSNPIDYWLGNINQRFVWNNLVTIKFWIVNELFMRWFAQGRTNYLQVDIREYASDLPGTTAKIRQFLDLPAETALLPEPPDGFIRFNKAFVDKIERDAATLVPIYRDHALYKLALSIDQWSGEFLANKKIQRLLAAYRDFWNTTAHTNLDWIGPLEEEIVELALEQTGLKSERNLSCWFYHECFELTCDHYEHPQGKLEHYLGSLEEEILLPPIAYYARVAVCYLENVIGNCLRRPYSAVPIRQTSLYRRLTDPAYSRFFPLWAMTEKMNSLELAIDQADAAMANYYPIDR